jgi:NADH-quinone oxidoreductase subunit N
MNATEVLVGMLPEHVLLAGIVLVIVRELVGPGDGFGIALFALLAAAAAALVLATTGYVLTPFPGQLSVTPLDYLAKAVVLALSVPVLLLSRDEFAECRFHVLVLSSLYGVCLMLSSDSFLTLFVGLELMSLPVYVLVVLGYRGSGSAEAALKYLVLGGAASATLLMGASFLYGGTGSLSCHSPPL